MTPGALWTVAVLAGMQAPAAVPADESNAAASRIESLEERLARLEEARQAGAPEKKGGLTDVVTVGVNWWPVKYVRVSLNFVREMYGEDLAFENGRQKDALNGVLARFQIDF